MHLVFHMANGGQIWLGGLGASGQVPVMLRNGISTVVACQKAAPPAKDSRIDYFELDAVGLLAGSIDLEVLRHLLTQVYLVLERGQKVLFCCGSGSYRSALVCACQLIYMTQSEVPVVVKHLQQLRNVVCFGATPKGGRAAEYEQKHGQPVPTPLAWLLSNSGPIAAMPVENPQHRVHEVTTLNFLRQPSQFRLMALNSGVYVENEHSVALRPKAKAKASSRPEAANETEAFVLRRDKKRNRGTHF